MDADRWKRIDQLLDAAFEQRPENRPAFLDQACGDDESLKKEIQALLDSDVRARSFIESPAIQRTSGLAAETHFTTDQLIGVYKIVSLLGKGGMGEVYLAQDTRLKRNVAIKLLPPSLSQNPQMRLRFEREARAISSLSHPNICSVFDVGEYNGAAYLVMEYIDGNTLAALIQKGPMSIRMLLDMAVAMADGLATAHRTGITHRDLKPANVMVTPEKRIKILDFGLAKLRSSPTEGESTVSELITQTGIIQGTVPYMSPEQATGGSVDFRSDQFSFGLIVYEMATGKRAFARDSVPQTLAAIISEDPVSISTLNTKIPAPLRWITERCLAKAPADRYESTLDLYHQLRDLRDHLSDESASEPLRPVKTKERKKWFAWTGVALLIAALLSLLWLFSTKTGWRLEKSGVESLPTFQQLTFQRGQIHSARFTPDGNTIVYSATFHDKPLQVFTVRPESPESQPVPVTPGDILSISRNGQIALGMEGSFIVGDTYTLSLAPLAGGSLRQLFENVRFADWSRDGKSLAIVRMIQGKNRLEFPAGKARYDSNSQIRYPRVSPKSDAVAFSGRSESEDWFVNILDSDGKNKSFSANANQGLAWSADGETVWYMTPEEGTEKAPAQASTLVSSLTVSGKQQTITRLPGNYFLYDISPTGDLLVMRMEQVSEVRGMAPGETEERDFSYLDKSTPWGISSDGRALLINEWGTAGGEDGLIYVRSLDTPIPIGIGSGLGCALSPDGKWVISLESTGEIRRLVLHPVGPGESKPLDPGLIHDFQYWAAFLPSGKGIILNGSEASKGPRCYRQDFQGGKPHAITPEGVLMPSASTPVSPDSSTLIAIGADENFYFYPIDARDDARRVPGLSSKDRFHRWSKDGRSVFISSHELPGTIFRVDISSGRRNLWKEIIPPDRATLINVMHIQLSADVKSYYYRASRTFSELYLIRGLK